MVVCWWLEEIRWNINVCPLLLCLFQLNIKEGDWLRNSGHNPDNDNILLIHGYAGGDNQLPTVVLRDGVLIIIIYVYILKNCTSFRCKRLVDLCGNLNGDFPSL